MQNAVYDDDDDDDDADDVGCRILVDFAGNVAKRVSECSSNFGPGSELGGAVLFGLVGDSWCQRRRRHRGCQGCFQSSLQTRIIDLCLCPHTHAPTDIHADCNNTSMRTVRCCAKCTVRGCGKCAVLVSVLSGVLCDAGDDEASSSVRFP